jgi:hypothetical protein
MQTLLVEDFFLNFSGVAQGYETRADPILAFSDEATYHPRHIRRECGVAL